MSPRFLASFLVPAMSLAVLSGAASAQTSPPPDERHAPGQPMQPPKELPRAQKGDRTRNLDFLFGALKAAPDADTAKQVEARIWALWIASGSDTANLLMSRVKTATDANDLELALRLLDALVKLKPDYVEAWNRRATIHYMRKEFGQSMQDIRQVLSREP